MLQHCSSSSIGLQTARKSLAPLQHRVVRATHVCRAEEERQDSSVSTSAGPRPQDESSANLNKELSKFTTKTAATFAPRASGAVKNPAIKGSTLYQVFEVQAWISLALGGLLSYNLLFPTDTPSIPRLMGMWSIWMFTIPSLRAKECNPREKEALNLLFLLVPLINVTLPFVWKSFPFIFTADVAAVVGVYAWKGVWAETYGIPLGTPAATLGMQAPQSTDADA